jgi:biotin carboxyl carrier protein
MMAVYRITIAENEYTIEVTEDGVRINGEEIEADLLKLNDAGLFLLNHGGEKLELHLTSEGANTYMVTADGQQIEAQVETDRSQKRQKKSFSDSKELRAPIPGVVLEIQVAVGDSIDEGQVACILESMKMQMVIKTSTAGRVTEMFVKPGQNVAKGDVLLRFE